MKLVVVFASLMFSAAAFAQDGGKTVYRCPGATASDPPLYTDALSSKEAQAKNCRTLEGAPITVIQGPRPRTTGATTPPTAGPATSRVDPMEQRVRDSDARRILEAELAKAEGELAALQKEYNHGEPERQGNERNYQKYIDRTADLKAGVARKESDVAAIKRELAKLP